MLKIHLSQNNVSLVSEITVLSSHITFINGKKIGIFLVQDKMMEEHQALFTTVIMAKQQLTIGNV